MQMPVKLQQGGEFVCADFADDRSLVHEAKIRVLKMLPSNGKMACFRRGCGGSLHPGGITACSRWLSEARATPPD